jgi:hypothetical protein
MLADDSPRDLEGKALVELLMLASNDPAIDPQDIELLTEKLEDILIKVDAEIVAHNNRVQLGKLLLQFHPDSWVHDLINSMEESSLKQFLLDHITQGETYEYNNQQCASCQD